MAEASLYVLSFSTGYFYIGSTSDFHKRIDRHRRELASGKHHNVKVQKQYDACEDFKVCRFICDSLEEARLSEDKYLKMFIGSPRILNIGSSAKGGDNLTHHPNRDVLVEKINSATIARYADMSASEKKTVYGRPGHLNPMFGKTHSVETRRKQSMRRTGVAPANKGKKMPEHQLLSMIERQKKRIGTLNSFYGKKHSVETKEKLRKSKLGVKPTNSRRVQIGNSVFDSIRDAARYLKVDPALIHYRLKKKEKYSDYRLL